MSWHKRKLPLQQLNDLSHAASGAVLLCDAQRLRHRSSVLLPTLTQLGARLSTPLVSHSLARLESSLRKITISQKKQCLLAIN